MAATLFSEPPNATFEDAMKHFEDAERYCNTPHIENKLFLGKCYISLRRYEEAVQCLRNLLRLSANSEKEHKILEEAETLLTKYAG